MANIEEHLRKVLNKVAVENKYRNYEIIIKEISSGGANYTSKLFTVIIREPNKDDLHLFAKYAAIGEATRNLAPVNIFETEVKAYTKLWKVYEALEKEHGLPEEHKLLFTKCYDFDLTLYQETLILENLIARGYGPCDRFQSIDWEYSSAAVTELAKFHALSFAYSNQYPEEFEKFLTDIRMEIPPEIMDGMLQGAIASALKAVRPEYREALDDFLKKYMKNLLPTFYTPTRRTIIVHGDYRGNNLLHKTREDGTVDIKIVDFQTLQGGSPVTDLLYFIFTGSDEQFRGQYYEKLVNHYYTQLSESMKRLHLNPDEVYSREVFDYELKEKLPFGLSLAVFSLPIITVDTEDAPQVNDDLNLTNFTIEKTSDLYVERLNGVVNDYVKWGILN